MLMNNCAVGVLETITLTPLVHGKDVLDGRCEVDWDPLRGPYIKSYVP